MEHPIAGIHHVTAIAGSVQKNVDFNTRFLGLRLVKKTVNFDDPGTYHLYYGDEAGLPGTIMTFFPWPGSGRGRRGIGQATSVAYAIPPESVGFWVSRAEAHGLDFKSTRARFGDQVITVLDPDGMRVDLVADRGAAGYPAWADGPVSAVEAVRCFHSVALCVRDTDRTAQLLEDIFGYIRSGQERNRIRLASPSDARGSIIDLMHQPDERPGSLGAGSVHHVAFRVPDAEAQRAVRQELSRAGMNVTEVIDRMYFQSIYFREPGGVLFEIATDTPGFAVDESPAELGSRLTLPPWLEPRRAQIEQALPPISGAQRSGT